MKEKRCIIVLSILCFISIIMMIVALSANTRGSESEFIEPKFDASAEIGFPDVDEELPWTEIYQEGMSFSAYICGKLALDGDSALIYFTNSEDNQVWLKLRILNSEDEVIAETGIIKPNEYIESIEFQLIPQSGETIKLKLMAYEPNTYYSEGSVTLNTIIE